MSLQKSRILAQSILRHAPKVGRLARHPRASLAVGLVSLTAAAAVFGLAPGEDTSPILQQTVIEQLAVNASQAIDTGTWGYLREERVQRGDTIAALLSRLGVADGQAATYLRTAPESAPVHRQLAPGKIVSARSDDAGRLLMLYFPLNSQDQVLIVERRGEGFATRTEALKLTTHVQQGSGEIRTSLFAAADAADIPDGIASQLADIFGSEVDFHRDLQRGDRFHLVYEMLYHQGQPIRAGRILAAEFINAGKRYSAVYYQASHDAKGGYYTPNGRSLRKSFLRSPLEFSRVTSGFSNARMHPVFHQMRAHKGVDYGAPVGTRVRAVGDGVVAFAGHQGGYGNLVVLRHSGNYSTAYGHLSRFAPGLKVGSRVSQGDIIAFTGQTGWATGPHLHYEFRIADQQVNPLSVNLPGTPPLATAELTRFRKDTAPLQAQLALIKRDDEAVLTATR